jgi:hypothetical protein
MDIALRYSGIIRKIHAALEATSSDVFMKIKMEPY